MLFILTCSRLTTITLVLFLFNIIPYSSNTLFHSSIFFCKSFSLFVRITMSSETAPSDMFILSRFLYPTCSFLTSLEQIFISSVYIVNSNSFKRPPCRSPSFALNDPYILFTSLLSSFTFLPQLLSLSKLYQNCFLDL